MKSGVLFLLIFSLVASSVSASELVVEKEDFVGGETLVGQVILDDTPEGSVLREGITLGKVGVKQEIVVFLFEEDKKSYYFYFDIPRTIAEGQYEVRTRVMFVENNFLREDVLSKSIDVKKVDSRFEGLEDAIGPDGGVNNDFLTTAFAALALKNVNPSLASRSADLI